jgi:hypothetical protein
MFLASSVLLVSEVRGLGESLEISNVLNFLVLALYTANL